MAGMFLADADDRAALASLSHMFVGGEALKSSLLAQLRQATKATITNMYGPTETTIWSSTSETSLDDDVAPLGRPIANTQLYVLDPFLQPVPAGIQGELFIGGDGVTRGYLHREELTQQRFLPNPFAPGRMYRTGDSVRYDEKGNLAFLGRNDNQVKIRGNRIELGEIEARIAEFAGVRDAVVVVREDRPGDKRIVAYLRATRPIAFDQLKAKLGTNLPEYMVPSHFMVLDAFPLTPNAKIDRAQLPPPKVEMIEIDSQPEAAMQEVERSIAEYFSANTRGGAGRTARQFLCLGRALPACGPGTSRTQDWNCAATHHNRPVPLSDRGCSGQTRRRNRRSGSPTEPGRRTGGDATGGDGIATCHDAHDQCCVRVGQTSRPSPEFAPKDGRCRWEVCHCRGKR